jgi:hypothetical protein
MEIESDGAISFLDVLVIWKETTLTTKVYGTLANISTSVQTICCM